MWPWPSKRLSEPPTTLPEPSKQAQELADSIATLTRHMAELRQAIADLQADNRRLEAEWLDHYDRTQKQVARLIKREERAAAAEAAPLTPRRTILQEVKARALPHSAGNSGR